MKLLICAKCAHESAATLKLINQRSEKTTCTICGRKRFCMEYEVDGE